MISGFLYAIVAYVAQPELRAREPLTVAKIAAMCLVAVVTVPLARVVAFGLLGRASVGSVPVIVVGHRASWPRPWPATCGPIPA